MLDDLIAEAERQFTICNACRYCEGICTVFPAMELHSGFDIGDVAYLSTLCHDCRACVQACPFSPPHEYAVDIPSLMAAARSQTFERYARPRGLWRLLSRPSAVAALVVLGTGFFLIVALATGDAGRIVHTHRHARSFYEVIAYLWLVIPGSIAAALAASAIVAGCYGLAREAPGGARTLLQARALRRAASDALGLKNLRGGGAGCYYPADKASSVRRRLHHLVFYGFGGMFVATVSAAFEQDLLGIEPPFPLLSVPVLFGLLGGLATLCGCAGFLILGVRSRDRRKVDEARRLDRTFTIVLGAAVVSGLLAFALRSTVLMGPVLILHLGVLTGFFVALPYSKFVHWGYRYVALVRSHVELDR